ncbi:MAG: ankyrin repeat domain-containing protein [Verrucomicrobia bacterium]|nr:ankyrin repeat domain-containing protein [Verrucomicrobiota bacterium]
MNLADEKLGATPLYHAVDVGNPELVRVLLKAGAKVNAKANDGMTPMLRAAVIVNPEVIAGFLSKGLPPILPYGSGAERTASREALHTLQKSLVPGLVLGPEEEASRLAILRLLVERGASMSDIMPDTKCTPLHFAVLIPNIKALEYLLEQGADPEVSAQGFRPLHFAVQWGNAEMVKVLIAHKAAVNATQVPAVDPPLHVAVFGGNMEIIRLLLDHGAKVNAVGKNRSPALHHATWNDEIFNFLLERGADPKLEQSDGTTTLHLACQDGSKALVEKLLQLQPDLDAWDGAEFTPLLNAAEAGRVDLMKLLLGAGAYLMATEKNGMNALHLAARSESPEAVRFLLDRKMDIHARSVSGMTALMYAAEQGRLETVALLLRAGATVNVETTNGGTPLMGAAYGTRKWPPVKTADDQPVRDSALAPDYLKIAELLLAGRADVQARDREGKTALHYAALSGNVEVLELLISKGVAVNDKDTRYGRTPLHRAAFSADVKTVAALLNKGADITARDAYGLQAIHAAAKRNDPAVLNFLLEKGAAVTAAESHGGTPLHCAAIESKPEAARVLLEHGAPPAALDQYKKSPLHFAALLGSVEIVRLLLDHQAPVNGADFQGDTPLHVAAMVRVGQNDLKATPEQPAATVNSSMAYINKSQPADKLKIVKLLLAKGAKPNVKNQEGATPIDVAGQFGTPEILAVLKSNTSRPPAK